MKRTVRHTPALCGVALALALVSGCGSQSASRQSSSDITAGEQAVTAYLNTWQSDDLNTRASLLCGEHRVDDTGPDDAGTAANGDGVWRITSSERAGMSKMNVSVSSGPQAQPAHRFTFTLDKDPDGWRICTAFPD